MAEANDWNSKIIAEFRANEGKVGGPFDGAPLLLLTTRGRKSGAERTNPMMYLADGDRLLVFASKAGAPTHPDWYLNLLANPHVFSELGHSSLIAVLRSCRRVQGGGPRGCPGWWRLGGACRSGRVSRWRRRG